MLIAIFILGAILGSFGYALICRIHNSTSRQQGRATMIDRSRSDLDGSVLHRYQLIPLISRGYHMIRGKSKPLSRRYPISEVMMGAVFVITYMTISSLYRPYHQREQIQPMLIIAWIINRGLSLLIIYDIKTYQLHLPVRMMTLVLSLGVQFLGITGDYVTAFVSSLTIAGIFWLFSVGGQYWMQQRYGILTEGFGQGDILVGFLIGSLRAYISTLQDIGGRLMSISVYISLSAIVGIIHYGLRIIWMLNIHQSITKQNKIGYPGPTESIPFIPGLIIAGWIMVYVRPIVQGG